MIGEQERQAFLECGYLVIPGVLPLDLCQRVVDAILAFTGVRLDDRATWHPQRFAGLGVVPLHHHQALWDVRQHPAVYEVFRELYGREDLWVSMDRAGYKPPASDGTKDWDRAPIHWDCDPWSMDELSIQGLFYLTDTSEDQGAFSCVPSMYRNLGTWRADHAEDENRRYPRVAEQDVVAVAGGAGSLVVFNRLMPHTNGLNRSPRPRFAQYVTMSPAGGTAERAIRVEQWQKNMPPQWAIRQKEAGQLIPEPGSPARLTELGRKLVGVDSWSPHERK